VIVILVLLLAKALMEKTIPVDIVERGAPIPWSTHGILEGKSYA
jgi:hypothetical protein